MDRRAFLMAAPSALLVGKAFAIGKNTLPVVPYGPGYKSVPPFVSGTQEDTRLVVRITRAAKHAMRNIPYQVEDSFRLKLERKHEMMRLYDSAVESVVGFRGPFIISSEDGDMTHWGCCDHPQLEVLPGSVKIPARRIEFSEKLMNSFGDKHDPGTAPWDRKNDYWALFSYVDHTELYKKMALEFNGRKKTS